MSTMPDLQTPAADAASQTQMPAWREDALIICAAYKVSLSDVLGPRHFPHLNPARSALAAVLRFRGLSYPQIGRLMHRHHSTIMARLRR